MVIDPEGTHFIYIEDNTIPGLQIKTLVNYLPSLKAAQNLLSVLLDKYRRHGAYNSGNEIRIMEQGKIVKRWVIETINKAESTLTPHADKLLMLQGVWSVKSFVMRNGTTYPEKWEAFNITGCTIQNKTYSTGKWRPGPDGVLVIEESGQLAFYFDQKPKWTVHELQPNKLVLINQLKNLTYTCQRIYKKADK
jgi:hypothetical protein